MQVYYSRSWAIQMLLAYYCGWLRLHWYCRESERDDDRKMLVAAAMMGATVLISALSRPSAYHLLLM
jgi:hypothetical protein